ncbi:MAG: hypothetical protein EAZ44_00840 [Cytophagia bacterium]|nr:MAG: hypothetical protein EAZ44_00840 [Cytophagia bacterium]TAG44391.1 MAG: hypothetical protein EAZ31_02375 [Cytophagia bacterium]
MKNKIVIVIPVYKPVLTDLEIISLKQCTTTFNNKYSIILVAPEGMDCDSYYQVNKELKTYFFDAFYFESVINYSKLLLLPTFYERFSNYDYMLLYQLDAYVFYDKLEYWCEQKYDYIGAPWISEHNIEKNRLHYAQATNSKNFLLKIIKKKFNFSKGKKIFVGNGGFSLRKIKTFIRIAKKLTYIGINIENFSHNEDIIWGIYVPCYFPFYKVPTTQTALKFAFEELPSYCYKLNQEQLPFGVHAWEKYENDFWKKFITF